MKWKMKENNFILLEEEKKHIQSKLEKIEKLLDKKPSLAEVSLTQLQHEKKHQFYQAQITIKIKQKFLRAEQKSQDMITSFNEAFEIIQRQLKKYQGKKKSKITKNPTTIKTTIKQPKKNVIREKNLILELKSIDEAIEQLELLNHDFYLFIEEKTKISSIVYKRDEGGYGLIKTAIA